MVGKGIKCTECARKVLFFAPLKLLLFYDVLDIIAALVALSFLFEIFDKAITNFEVLMKMYSCTNTIKIRYICQLYLNRISSIV